MRINKATKRWIKDAGDEHAAANGCRFDESRGQHVIDFIEQNLRLYEGEYAGQTPHIMGWQYDLLMRLFGWVRWSEDWERNVRRFRKASVWIPKKNGKSPTAAMIGLYLLVADGEQGQKVYSAAKDGGQAAIMHTHARMMVEQSPNLSAECKINKSSGRISHLPSRSFYSILAGDNIKGQEGLNGSVVIDEVHVVDDRLAKVLEYMGASRSEPIQLEVSTAGNNPEGYGKSQQDYGRSVSRGETVDDEFLSIIYEAPQAATDEKCEDVETWQQANPGWGLTIKESEFRSSCQRAKRSLSDWQTWKMYRLNIWSNAANPWLRPDDWQSCASELNIDDFFGQACYVGLDLSKTKDMTAAVFVFKEDDDEYAIFPFFWLPRHTAQNTSKVPFMEWAEAGYIELTPGGVVDYQYVEKRIRQLSDQVNVEKIVYDKTYAEELTQRLEDGIGCERQEFPQTIHNFAGPTAEFERLVIAGKLRHPNSPVLNWQAINVNVKSDANNNKRPVKPKSDDHRKIDGIVAGIMGLSQAMIGESAIYDGPGVYT